MSRNWYKPFIVRHKFFVLFLCVAVGLIIWGICSCVSYNNNRPIQNYVEAMKFAKKEVGLDKILWVGSSGDGYFLRDVPLENAVYIIGIKSGQERFFAVPCMPEKRQPPIELEWEFDYSFSEMISWLGEYGYEHVGGYPDTSLPSDIKGLIEVYGRKEQLAYIVESFGIGVDEFYAALDIKAVFGFRRIISGEIFYDYYITQEGGRLKLYERFFNEGEISVHTVFKDGE